MIELRGSYRYASRAALDLALEAARTQLRDDDELDADWLRSITTRGTTLAVNARLERADPFATAHALQTLAAGAVEGAIDLERRGTIERFAPGDDS